MRSRRLLRNFAPLLAAFVVMAGVGFLPPDTSRREVAASGRLRVCMPPDNSPWSVSDPGSAGFDLAVLSAAADPLGWRIEKVPVPAMDAGVNPRRWGLRRSRCRLVAGGLALTPLTRAMLDAGPAWAADGWRLVSGPGVTFAELEDPVGVVISGPGAERLALGRLLRERGLEARPLPSVAALRRQLESGELVAGIASYAAAEALAESGWQLSDLPGGLGATERGPGFWKGDATLARALRGRLRAMEEAGRLGELRSRYGVGAPDDDSSQAM